MKQADARVRDLAPGSTTLLEFDGQPVAVANVGGKLYAFEDLCPHRSCSLSQGELDGSVISCPCHGSLFDVTTGAVVRGPARRSLATYEVEAGPGGLTVHAAAATQPTAPRADNAEEPPAAETPPAAAREGQDDVARRAAEEDQDILSQVPLFSDLDRDAIRALQAFTFRRTFQPGEVIVEEGRTGNGLYVIRSGRVDVIRGMGGERSHLLATFGPGDPFGELALLGEWKRTASVRAIDEVTCIGIDRWVFLAYLRRQPEVAVKMLQIVAERLVLTDQRLTG